MSYFVTNDPGKDDSGESEGTDISCSDDGGESEPETNVEGEKCTLLASSSN